MLKEHLHQLQGSFELFTQVTTRNLNNLPTFSQKVLKIIQTQNTHVSRAMKELKCDVASVGAMVAYQNILQVFQHKLQELFFAINHGKLMTDTTQILRIENLKTKASETKDFQQTIFAKYPEIFYKVGNLFSANVMNNNHFLVFHFIVVAPELKLEKHSPNVRGHLSSYQLKEYVHLSNASNPRNTLHKKHDVLSSRH